MVWVVVRVRELDTECGYEEEVGGSRDVVFAENVEGTMDGEADKPGSATDGKHVQDTPYHYKKKTIKVHWASAESTKPIKGLFAWDGGRESSKRKANNEIYGRIEDVTGVQKRW